MNPEQIIETGPPKRYLILDTNIVSRAAHLDRSPGALGPQIFAHIVDLLSKSPGWEISLSEISIFELFNIKTVEREIEHQNTVSGLHTFAVNTEVLRAAARLNVFYQSEEVGLPGDEIEVPDLIIAATSHLTGSPVYTTNMRDYPAPFFTEMAELRKIYEYPVKRSVACLPTYFMMPQTDMSAKYFEKRFQDKDRLHTHLANTTHLALKPVKSTITDDTFQADTDTPQIS